MSTTQHSILIVDDEHALVEMMSQDLKALGYAIEEAFDGIEALEKVEHFKPDLIISDINMPRMNGLEFLISVNERGHRIPVIILTGFGDYHAIRTAWKFGAYDFIEKPIDRETLSELVRTGLTLGKDQAVVNQRSLFSHSVFKNIQIKMDETQYHQASQVAGSLGLSMNSLFQRLLNEHAAITSRKAS